MSELPFSQSCENNKLPILAQLKELFKDARRVLEIGSGTGQHCVYFAEHLPHLFWQTSDQSHYHEGINAWIEHVGLSNVGVPFEWVLPSHAWPKGDYDGVFTANTAHIMQKEAVQSLMERVAENLPSEGVFCQYGPFIQNGEFSSQGNVDFHHKLVSEGYGGYRHIEELQAWAAPLALTKIIPMPANNLLLVWTRQ